MTPVAPTTSKTFRDEGQRAVHALRQSLADILGSLGADPSQPQELSRKFGLDKMLTWRVSRVTCGEDTWEAIHHVPRRPSMVIFANAMQKHGASAAHIDALWAAVDTFERFVDDHAGDRGSLEIMASAATRRGAAKRLEQFRKDGFYANASIWGVSARVQLAIRLVVPGEAPGMLSIFTVCGLIDFRRLRPDVRWAAASNTRWGSPDFHQRVLRCEPLAPELGGEDVPLLPQFCSTPLPAMFTRIENETTARFMIDAGPVGNHSAATVILGWRHRDNVPMRASVPDEQGEHGANLSTPVELLLHDLYIHRSLDFAGKVSAHVFGMLPGGPRYPSREESEVALPVETHVIDLGEGPPDTTTPDVPRYAELLAWTVQRCGFPLKDFRGARLRLRYPPIPAISVLRHGLMPA